MSRIQDLWKGGELEGKVPKCECHWHEAYGGEVTISDDNVWEHFLSSPVQIFFQNAILSRLNTGNYFYVSVEG
jgi:hypothetical protein